MRNFESYVSLREMKSSPDLAGMRVVQRWQRLSIQPVEKEHFVKVCRMGGIEAPT